MTTPAEIASPAAAGGDGRCRGDEAGSHKRDRAR